MIAMLAMAAMVVGVVLGLRLTVVILIPAIAFGSAIALGIGIAHSDSLWSIFIAVGLTTTALQMGYLTGTFVRFVIPSTRARNAPREIIGVAQRSAR
jgi:hypothetical protein